MPCLRQSKLLAQQVQAPVLHWFQQRTPVVTCQHARRNARKGPPSISLVRMNSYTESSTVSERPAETVIELAVDNSRTRITAADSELAVLIAVLPARVQALLQQRSTPIQVDTVIIIHFEVACAQSLSPFAARISWCHQQSHATHSSVAKSLPSCARFKGCCWYRVS